MKVPIMYHVYIQSVFLCFGNDVRSRYMSNYDIGVSVMMIINICQFYNIRHKHNYHQISWPRNNCRERVKLVYFATQLILLTGRVQLHRMCTNSLNSITLCLRLCSQLVSSLVLQFMVRTFAHLYFFSRLLQNILGKL